MISKAEFSKWSLRKKIRMLYEEGHFVVNIRYYGYKINLYLLHGFYVEIFYHHKRDVIEKIEPMDDQHTRIKFYADQIHLPNSLFD